MALSMGQAVLTLRADQGPLNKGLATAQKTAKSKLGAIGKHWRGISTGMIVAGAAVSAGLVAMAVKFAKAGDEVQKMALRTGFSTEMLSELRHAAELSGTSLAGLETGIKKMQRVITEAGTGAGEYVDALAMLGLTYEDLAALSPEEQFLKLIMALADVENATTKAGVAQEIFGRAGTMLLPMLASGAAGLQEMREEAHKLGLVFDQEAADKAALFNDQISRLQGAFQGLIIEMGPVIADIISDLIPAIIDAVVRFREWAQENEGLISGLLKAAMVIAPLSLALGTMMKFIVPMAIAFKVLGAGATGGAIGGATVATKGLTMAIAGSGGLALALGIGAIAAWSLYKNIIKGTDALIRMSKSSKIVREGEAKHTEQIERLIVAMEAEGIEVDRSMLAGKSLEEQRKILDEVINKNIDSQKKSTEETNTGKQASIEAGNIYGNLLPANLERSMWAYYGLADAANAAAEAQWRASNASSPGLGQAGGAAARIAGGITRTGDGDGGGGGGGSVASMSGGVTITGNTFNVRKESDIRSVAEEMLGLMQRKTRGRGGNIIMVGSG